MENTYQNYLIPSSKEVVNGLFIADIKNTLSKKWIISHLKRHTPSIFCDVSPKPHKYTSTFFIVLYIYTLKFFLFASLLKHLDMFYLRW